MYQIYQIQFNDTLESIAKQFNTTANNLKHINGITNTLPMVGISIIVPKTENGNERYNIYTIQKDDSLYSISKKYDIPVNTLVRINGLNQNDYLYPGQELIVPKANDGIYMTTVDDTIEKVSKNTGTSIMDLINYNEDIFLIPEQIIFYNKNKNYKSVI